MRDHAARLRHDAGMRAEEMLFRLSRPMARRRATTPKRVILHAGLRKCGSTSIQETFRENAALLTPHVGFAARRFGISTKGLVRRADALTETGTRRAALRYRMEAARLAAAIDTLPQDVVIVSEENAIGARCGVGSGDIFAHAAELLQVFEREFAGADLTVVLYTRERERWLRSCWNQDVKLHGFHGDFAAWREWVGPIRSDEAGLRHVADTLSSPVEPVRLEDEAAAAPCIGAHLLRRAGVPEDVVARVRPSSRRNRSLGPGALSLMQQVNRLDIPAAAKRRVGILARRNPELFREGGS